MTTIDNKPTVLITDDDDAAAHLLQTNLRRTGLVCSILRARDGRQAIDILENRNSNAKIAADSPVVMLLDIRMPRMDGIQVLEYVKKSDNLKRIPVIMLTTTDDPREVERCYDIGCNFYVTKPVDYGKFVSTIKNLAGYIEICTLPTFQASSIS